MHRLFMNTTLFLLDNGESKYWYKTSQVRSFKCVHFPFPQPFLPQVLVSNTDLDLWSADTMKCPFGDDQLTAFSLFVVI